MGLRRLYRNWKMSRRSKQEEAPQAFETGVQSGELNEPISSSLPSSDRPVEPQIDVEEVLHVSEPHDMNAAPEEGPILDSDNADLSEDGRRYRYYAEIVDQVDKAVETIRSLDDRYLADLDYLEHQFIPALGLNNEILNEQPAELSAYFGTGLHLWQYPSQFAAYLAWLAQHAKEIKSYAEIGCRWGGTFIIINEWLKRIGAPVEFAIACDPIEITPFVRRYQDLCDWPVHYRQQFSTDQDFIDFIQDMAPEFVFLDGDHSIEGVMHDHLITRARAKIIVHHDITSDACWGSSFFWRYAKAAEDNFDAFEFTQQYDSVDGSFLGIGVLKRKAE